MATVELSGAGRPGFDGRQGARSVALRPGRPVGRSVTFAKEIKAMATQSNSGRRRHLLSALVQNQPGVLAHVSGMFASRGFNIESLAVGETENPVLSRITVVVMGDDRHLDQVRKQLEKIVTVVKVHDISREDYVERDLMLIKIGAPAAVRLEIQALVQIFRGRIVDVSPDHLMIEISGQERKIEAFIEQVRPYGIREMARTGRIALVRGDQMLEDQPEASESPGDEPEPLLEGHSEL
jgi:acetolactate synthase-1/3 small subunit